jgi:hypothetical protein
VNGRKEEGRKETKTKSYELLDELRRNFHGVLSYNKKLATFS